MTLVSTRRMRPDEEVMKILRVREIFEALLAWKMKRKGFQKLDCKDCGIDCYGEQYVVWDEVWRKANRINWFGYLCIGCIENRLNRKLLPSDFPDLDLNIQPYYWEGQSIRLLDRKGSIWTYV